MIAQPNLGILCDALDAAGEAYPETVVQRLSALLDQYRNGERGLPTYRELTELVAA